MHHKRQTILESLDEPFEFKYGANPSVDVLTAGSHEDILAHGGTAYLPDVAVPAANIAFASTSDQDKPGGTGAHTLSVLALDADFYIKKFEIELNGLTPVYHTLDLTRIHRMRVADHGTAERHPVGTITATVAGGHADAGEVMASILPDEGGTMQAVYTLPANYRYGILVAGAIGLTNRTSANLTGEVYTREYGGAWIVRASGGVSQNKDWEVPGWAGIKLLPRQDIKLTCAEATANGLYVMGNFRIDLYE